MFKKPFVVLDLETTGVDPKKDDIIEVAAVRYENGKEVSRYTSLVKIDYKLPEIITAITGITDADLKENGKPEEIVYSNIEGIIDGAYLVGHNIQFDFGFLKLAGIKNNILGLVDTIQLAQILYPNSASYSLESLTDDLGIEHEHKHRAMGDVEATLELFKASFKSACELPKPLMDEINSVAERSDWTAGVFFEEAGEARPPLSSRPKRRDSSTAPGITNTDDGIKRALQINEIFGEKGAMIECRDEYESRPQQIEMADNVLNAFQQGYHLICEAPTGIGKSLAYLAAAANISIENKSKVVISTNTINLQQQLFEKDLPLLQSIYKNATGNAGVKAALLKGRSNYLCLRRLAEFKRRPRFTHDELILLIKILVWQYKTETGDNNDINLTRPETLIWDFELCADHKYCTPQKCKAFGECYLHKARRKAEEADIIIVNHALLCSDIISGGGLLPEYNYLVVDEAHHFEEVATRSLGVEVKQENLAIPIKALQNHLDDMKRRFSGTLFINSKALESVDSIIDSVPDLQQSVDNFFNIVALFVGRNVPESGYIENLLIDPVITATQEWLNIGLSLTDVTQKAIMWLSGLKKIAEAVQATQDNDDGFTDELMQEIGTLSEQLAHLNNFFNEDHEDKKWIRWISSDLHGIVTINLAPLTTGPYLKDLLYDKKKSIVLTSATLGVKLAQEGGDGYEQHPFTYLRQMLGLDDKFEEVVLDSPFDYEKQVYVIMPTGLEPVQSKKNIEQASGFFKRLIKSVGGGMLGLFTSYGALENVYLNLMHELTPKDPKVLAQRISGGRAKIMKSYMKNPKNSVLLGTASFWEGVDIAGDALTTLVIHKLPFDVPSDPIYKVRGQMFNNGFMEYSVPRAILRFRQGFGRLIRSKKDYGVMIVLDDRVLGKEYGQMFLASLPKGVTIEKMPLDEVEGKAKEWLTLMANSQ